MLPNHFRQVCVLTLSPKVEERLRQAFCLVQHRTRSLIHLQFSMGTLRRLRHMAITIYMRIRVMSIFVRTSAQGRI